MATKLGIWNRALSRIGETDKIEDVDEDRVSAEMCRLHYDDILRDMLAAYPWSWAIKEATLAELSTIFIDHTCDGIEYVFELPVQYQNLTAANGLTVTKRTTATLAELYELDLSASSPVDTGSSGTYNFTPHDPDTAQLAEITTVNAYGAGLTIRIEVEITRNGWEYAYSLPGDFVKGCGVLMTDVKFTNMPHASKAEWEVVPNPNGDSQMILCDIAPDDMAGFQYIALIDNPTAWPTQFSEAFSWRLAAELADAMKKDPKLSERCWQRYEIAINAAAVASGNNAHLVEPISPMIASRG